MARGVNEKKFEANVDLSLWEQYEAWAEGRMRIQNRQLLTALFRLFLSAPEHVKLLALYGKGDQLDLAAAGSQIGGQPPTDPLLPLRQIACEMESQAFSQLSPDEQAVVSQLREWAEDDRLAAEVVEGALIDEARQRGKKGGTAAKSRQSPKRQGRGRKTG